MADRLSDAELVERIKLHAKLGTTKAAAQFGCNTRTLQTALAAAKARGLTANTPVHDDLARAKARIKGLERDLAAFEKHNDNAEAIRKSIYNLATQEVDPPAWINEVLPHPLGTTFSVPLAMWSDWHWGEVVRPEEVGGVNIFNRAVAKQRLKRLVATMLDLCAHHMGRIKYPGIVICLGGDMISGMIHEELRETNEGSVLECVRELKGELIAALTQMANTFGKVFVPCVVGNHGRTTMRWRAKGRVYESYEWNLYTSLEDHFRDDKRVTFLIPEETDAYFAVLGHRILLTHGDSLGVKGGDGMIGALGPITRGAIKIGRSEAQIGRDFDTLMIGHWHMYTPRGEGSAVIVNGALKGYDEYARSGLRVPYSRPSQALTFIHAKHGITAQWQVYLDDKRTVAQSSDWVKFEQARRA